MYTSNMTSKEVKYQVQRQDYNRRKGKRFMVETFTGTETGFDNDQEFEADGLDLSKEYRIEVVARMTKDIKEKINADPALMTKDEIRFLVSSYYGVQDLRKLLGNRISALQKQDEAASMFAFVLNGVKITEKNIQGLLAIASGGRQIGQWAESIRGIGPVISAGLLAHIDIAKAPTVGHIWRFAGLDPTLDWLGKEKSSKLIKELTGGISGSASEEQFAQIATEANRKADTLMEQVQRFADSTGKGDYLSKDNIIKTLSKRPYNADLKLICWKAGESFVKVSNHEADVYGHVYASRKMWEIQNNESGKYADQAAVKLERVGRSTDAYKSYVLGKLPPAHLHARAKRYAVKLFLSHWHHVAYELEYGTPPPKPYILDRPNSGHTDFIAPPNWPME